MANGIMDIDTQFMLNSIPMDSKAFLPTNVPFDQSYMTVASQMAEPYTSYASSLGYGGDPKKIQGIGSDVRHTVGSAKGKFAVQDYLRDNFAIPTDSGLSNFLGNTAIVASTIGAEGIDAIKNIPEAGINFYKQPFEDIRANFRARDLKYGISDEDLLQYAISSSPSKYMIEQAKDTPNFPLNMMRGSLFPREVVDQEYQYGTVKANDMIPVGENPLLTEIDYSELDDLEAQNAGLFTPDTEKTGILKTLISRGKDIVGNISDKMPDFGITGLLSKLDNFKNLSPLDRQFILEQAGGNRPGKDRYGYNKRSAFGNYANLVGKKSLNALTKAKFGIPLTAMDKYYIDKEKARAQKERDILDEEFRRGRGGSGQNFTGGRYDGAPDAATYSAEPTKYSGSS